MVVPKRCLEQDDTAKEHEPPQIKQRSDSFDCLTTSTTTTESTTTTSTLDEPPPLSLKLGQKDCENGIVPIPRAATMDAPGRPNALRYDCDDQRVGLIFEASHPHVDPSRRNKERPQRILVIQQALQTAGLLSRCIVLRNSRNHQVQQDGQDDDNNTEYAIHPFLLQRNNNHTVHSPHYLQRLNRLSNCNCQERLHEEASQYASIYLTPHSVQCAQRAASSLCTLVEHVIASTTLSSKCHPTVQHGFALIRPPGHHATTHSAGGYCLLNNVALAAQYARSFAKQNKIAIVDWDVHHGNGTQQIFESNPNVLYMSVHRHQPQCFYPYGNGGSPQCIGTKGGVGFNVNIAFTTTKMGNDEYLYAFQTLIVPILHEFQPDLILVSAGFDAAVGEVGGHSVTPAGFASMTRELLSLSSREKRTVPVVCALEGGYLPSMLQSCVSSVVQTLLQPGPKPRRVSIQDVHPTAVRNVEQTKACVCSYWKCLQQEPEKRSRDNGLDV